MNITHDSERQVYLSEPFHWFDQGVVPFNVAEHVTLTTVARWADRYEAFSPGFPLAHQKGMLPVLATLVI